jgi:excisionase family DNA binding protein
MPDVLTVEQAAEYLQVPERILLAKAREGVIPGAKIGRIWRFSQRQLLEWLEDRARTEEEDRLLAEAAMEDYDDPDNQELLTSAEVRERLGL